MNFNGIYRKREGQYDDVEEKNYIVTEEKPTAENLITLNEFKHKENADEGKDLKKQQPPVLGSHSETLGFNTEGTEKTVEKKEVFLFFFDVMKYENLIF